MFETEDWPKTALRGRSDDTHRRKVRTLVSRNYYMLAAPSLPWDSDANDANSLPNYIYTLNSVQKLTL